MTQDPDPGAEEIDKALIQLGLVGNNTSILDRDTSKWRTVQEAPPTELSDNEAGNSGEATGSGGERDGSIFEEEAKSLGGLFSLQSLVNKAWDCVLLCLAGIQKL